MEDGSHFIRRPSYADAHRPIEFDVKSDAHWINYEVGVSGWTDPLHIFLKQLCLGGVQYVGQVERATRRGITTLTVDKFSATISAPLYTELKLQ